MHRFGRVLLQVDVAIDARHPIRGDEVVHAVGTVLLSQLDGVAHDVIDHTNLLPAGGDDIHPFFDAGDAGILTFAGGRRCLVFDPARGVFGAFCDSRLGGHWGHAFGTLGSGVDFDAILQRAMPR